MEWNELLKEVGVRFKYRSWLLIDLTPDAAQLKDQGLNLTDTFQGVTLILDCNLEGIFRLIETLGPDISYAASLQAARQAPPQATFKAVGCGVSGLQMGLLRALAARGMARRQVTSFPRARGLYWCVRSRVARLGLNRSPGLCVNP
ncbi:hypothetical protein [Pseudomonas gingeri]